MLEAKGGDHLLWKVAPFCCCRCQSQSQSVPNENNHPSNYFRRSILLVPLSAAAAVAATTWHTGAEAVIRRRRRSEAFVFPNLNLLVGAPSKPNCFFTCVFVGEFVFSSPLNSPASASSLSSFFRYHHTQFEGFSHICTTFFPALLVLAGPLYFWFIFSFPSHNRSFICFFHLSSSR